MTTTKPTVAGPLVTYNYPGSAKYLPEQFPAWVEHVSENGSLRLFIYGPMFGITQNVTEGVPQGDGPGQWNWPVIREGKDDSMTEKQHFKNFDPPERSRIYLYPNPDATCDPFRIEFTNVTAISVQPNGGHRLEMAGGNKAIIMPGFLAVLLEVDSWTF